MRNAVEGAQFRRDVKLAQDWLLIYKIDGDDLHLVRPGTHSDLF